MAEGSGFLGFVTGLVFVMFGRNIMCLSSRVDPRHETLQTTNPVTQCCIPEDLILSDTALETSNLNLLAIFYVVFCPTFW